MILLDTNVVSEVMKARPTEVVVAWLNAQDSEKLYVSAVTIGEIAYGQRILPDGKRRSGFRERFERFITLAFHCSSLRSMRRRSSLRKRWSRKSKRGAQGPRKNHREVEPPLGSGAYGKLKEEAVVSRFSRWCYRRYPRPAGRFRR